MSPRATKLTAFGLSIGQSVFGLVALLLLARFEGASSAYTLYAQISAFTLVMTAVLGVEASRHQMVHWRLNREPDQAADMIRALFSLLLVSRALLALLFLLAPPTLLGWLTNVSIADIEQERALVQILGAEQVGQLLLDVALFAGITRGWLISAPATAFVIYLLRVIVLFFAPDYAIEASVLAMLAGELLGAGYLLLRCFGKAEAALIKPRFGASAFARGLRIALPTSLLGFFPAFLIWGRNYLLAEVSSQHAIALFAYVQPLLMTVGLVFAITLNTSEGILVSDRKRPLEERKQMVLSGFIGGLTWALGAALIVAVLAPWIVRAAFAFGGGKLEGDDLDALATILRWMCGLVGGATLHAFAVKVAMGLAQNKRFFALNLIALAIGALVLLLFAKEENAMPMVALVSGSLSLLASSAFFMKVGGWSPRELAARMARPLMALAVTAVAAMLILHFELEAKAAEMNKWLDLGLLAFTGLAMLGAYLGIAWGLKGRRKA